MVEEARGQCDTCGATLEPETWVCGLAGGGRERGRAATVGRRLASGLSSNGSSSIEMIKDVDPRLTVRGHAVSRLNSIGARSLR